VRINQQRVSYAAEELPANAEQELVSDGWQDSARIRREQTVTMMREQVPTLGGAEEIAGQCERDSVSATMQRMFLGCAQRAKRGYGDEPWLQDRRTTVYAA
jgi:hypothetical protein